MRSFLHVLAIVESSVCSHESHLDPKPRPCEDQKGSRGSHESLPRSCLAMSSQYSHNILITRLHLYGGRLHHGYESGLEARIRALGGTEQHEKVIDVFPKDRRENPGG